MEGNGDGSALVTEKLITEEIEALHKRLGYRPRVDWRKRHEEWGGAVPPRKPTPDNHLARRVLAIRKRTTDTPGFVYFVRCEAYVKIGYAKNIINRLGGIAVNCPFPLTLVGYLKGSVETERELHNVFAEFRHQFEWFRYETEVAEAIKLSTLRPARYLKIEDRWPGRIRTIDIDGLLIRRT